MKSLQALRAIAGAAEVTATSVVTEAERAVRQKVKRLKEMELDTLESHLGE